MEPPLHIAWFHSHLLHANSGGTRFVLEYAAGLKRRYGHRVTVYCDVAGSEAADRFGRQGIRVREIDDASTNSAFYWLTLPLRLRAKRLALEGELVPFDVAVSTMFPMNWLVSGLRLPSLQICYEPFAFFHDPGFLRNFTPSQRLFFRLMAALYSGADREACRRMDRFLTINTTNVEKIRGAYGIVPEVVYAGVDTARYERAAPDAIESVRRRHRGNPLLFHSTDLTGIKASHELLELVAALRKSRPDMRLLVTIYVDDPAGTARFVKRIDELGLSDTVEFLGCLESTQLPAYYSAVDFVCQPSINQPTNWALREALICGTPIIGGVESEEAVDFRNGVRIDVRNIDESVRTLERLFDRRAELDVRATADAYRSAYSLDSCTDQLNRILLELAASRRA